MKTIDADLDASAATVREAESRLQAGASAYTFHQELRTYLDSLGDCYDTKVGYPRAASTRVGVYSKVTRVRALL